MNDQRQDPELRALFEAQRRHDAEHAPELAPMLVRARAAAASAKPARSWWPASIGRTGLRTWELAGGLAAAAAIAALIVIPRVRNGDDAFEQAVRAFQSDPALGAWQSPTDGLLSMPGDRLLTTIPNVGTEPQ